MLPTITKWPHQAAVAARTTTPVLTFLFTAAWLWSGSVQAGTQLMGFSVTPTPPPAVAPAPTGLLPRSTRLTLVIPAGSSFCGIDSIFANGYETPSFSATTQLPGGAASPGLIQDITGTGTTLAVALTTPSSTSDSAVDVTGTFTGPVNTGVAVNGVAGYSAGGKFVVPSVPLVSGTNTLNVTATILPGASVTNSSTIIQSGTPTPIVVATDRPIGYAPFAENFTYQIGALSGGATVASVAIDFQGRGTNDYSGTLANAPKTYTYLQSGLYTAKFVFTDSNNATYTINRSVLIQDLAIQRGMLCDVYGYLQDRLNAQDATGASNVFQPAERSTYATFFSGLGTDMPVAAAQLGVIVNGVLGTGFVDFLIVQDNADQTRSGYPLRMTQSGDGVWRISEM